MLPLIPGQAVRSDQLFTVTINLMWQLYYEADSQGVPWASGDLLVAMGELELGPWRRLGPTPELDGVPFTILCIVLDGMLAELGSRHPWVRRQGRAGQDALLSRPGPRRLEPPPRRLPFGLRVDPLDSLSSSSRAGSQRSSVATVSSRGRSPRDRSRRRTAAGDSATRSTHVDRSWSTSPGHLDLPDGDRAVRRGPSLLVRRPPAQPASTTCAAGRSSDPPTAVPHRGQTPRRRPALTRLLRVHVARGNERTDETTPDSGPLCCKPFWGSSLRRSLGARWVRSIASAKSRTEAGSSVTPLAVRPLAVPRLRRPHPPPH